MKKILLLAFLLFSKNMLANVIINGTRIIYPEQVDSVVIQLTNNSKTPSLVQSWVDNGNINSVPEDTDSSFYIYPPIVKIEGLQGQQLKLKKTIQNLPDNIESVFYLNVLDIPKTADFAKGKNVIQLATRSRVKIFYRPSGLTETPDEAYKKISYQLIGNNILIKNNSQYHFTIASITSENNKNKSLIDAEMISPLSYKKLPLKENLKNHNLLINYVTDFGIYKNINIKI
ncbi:molecular chaperone [Providencia burhodogranariea]|uniref:Pili assembly chaperone n=1 Tax=Providencia burhodogranariea DSM 19968 TaxID=1141662 RepID=K8X4P7_9GAMM|nr:molecular chaperone [Providencia burhodogranariea]EKT64657.1 pili assembly chaperone [Providencia burhodogranariea DSM 19968]